MDSSNSGTQIRQKRVLPSRSRRGGPGVGSCDADVMILETKRRQFENEPLIPVTTNFILTTNSALASTSSAPVAKFNVLANERYFDRPEVLKAYREQLIIETPKFVSLGDVPNAGRLRARSQAGITEDGPPETSDAAYEKRHRKYETFEKRQRLREKEKLKHEQYKLKERIEQLRVMESSAFLTLPASLFPTATSQTYGGAEGSQAESNGVHPNGAPAYHEGERRRKEMLDIAHILEDRYKTLLPPERGKKAFGQIAVDTSIEPQSAAFAGRDRYDTELDEEPFIETSHKEIGKLKLKIKFSGRPSLSTSSKLASSKRGRRRPPSPQKQLSVHRRTRANHEEEIPALGQFLQTEEIAQPEEITHSAPGVTAELEEIDRSVDVQHREVASPEGTIPSKEIEHPDEVVQLEETDLERERGFIEPEESAQAKYAYLESPQILATPLLPIASAIATPSPPPILTPQKPIRRAATPLSNPEIAVLQISQTETTYVNDERSHISTLLSSPEPTPAPHPHKRARISVEPSSPLRIMRDMSVPPITSISPQVRYRSQRPSVPYISTSGEAEKTSSFLLIAAIRSSGSSSRKAKRHLTAFGVKLRNEVFDDLRDFELPEWAYPREGTEDGEPSELSTEIPGVRTILNAVEFSKRTKRH